MKKKGKGIIFVLILLVVVGIGIYYFLNPEDNIIVNIFNDDKGNVSVDNRNGVYVYEEKNKNAVRVSSSCTITSIKYYVTVVNDKWYSYKDTCLGVFQLKEGKTNDLDILYDSDQNQYTLVYEENEYVRNDNVRAVVPNQTFRYGTNGVYLEGYKTLLRETMFDGNYFDFDRVIVGNGSMKLNFYRANNMFNIKINSSYLDPVTHENVNYVYSGSSIDNLPDFTTLNKKLVILDKYSVNNRVNYDLKLFSNAKGLEYSLKNVFPIRVNGVELSPDTHYVYVTYDVAQKAYILLVSPNKNYCVKDSKESKIAYYEFKIEIDYVNYTFKTPSFVRAWYEKEGCSYVDSLMEVS